MPSVPLHDAYFPSASAAYGESTFICPGIYMSKSYASFSPASWNYRFNVQQDGFVAAGLGVPHTSEIPAIFGVGMVNDNPELSSFATYNKNIVPIMMNYWISFVKAFDPNAFKVEQAPQWLPFGDEGNRVLFETNSSRMEIIPSEQVERCEFWRGLAVTMEL
jgi:acetylcholinesterase